MDGYEILLVVPPLLAVLFALVSRRAVKKGAADIDRRRHELDVLKEQELRRQSPPMRGSAPMQPVPPAP